MMGGCKAAGMVVLAVALAGCAIFKPAANPDVASSAATWGADLADIACTGVKAKAPQVVPSVESAITKGKAVLASDSITGAALVEAVSVISDPDYRSMAQAAVRILVRRTGGLENATVAKDSPLAVGAGGFFDECQLIIGQSA